MTGERRDETNITLRTAPSYDQVESAVRQRVSEVSTERRAKLRTSAAVEEHVIWMDSTVLELVLVLKMNTAQRQ